MILLFDTETTGKANFKLESIHASQPRLVQLAAILADDEGNEVSHIKLLVKPSGFEIPADATKVHGITTDRALREGIELKYVVSIFKGMLDACKDAVAFNFDFDAIIMERETHAIFGDRWKELFNAPRNFCAMRAMVPVCKLPPNFPGADYKWPELKEAYQHCFGKMFDKAHDALADVRATKEIWFWYQKNVAKTEQP